MVGVRIHENLDVRPARARESGAPTDVFFAARALDARVRHRIVVEAREQAYEVDAVEPQYAAAVGRRALPVLQAVSKMVRLECPFDGYGPGFVRAREQLLESFVPGE